MRGKSCSMDGLGEQPNFSENSGFYVPGERHENLPAGGFAQIPPYASMAQVPPYATMGRKGKPPKGMGTPVYSIWSDQRAPEYATGGSGMFQGKRQMADFGHGSLIASSRSMRGMGQSATSTSSGTSTADILAQAIQSGGQVAAAALTPAAVKPAAAAPVASTGILGMSTTTLLVVAAALGGGAWFFLKKKR